MTDIARGYVAPVELKLRPRTFGRQFGIAALSIGALVSA
jgi:hypothetical protein